MYTPDDKRLPEICKKVSKEKDPQKSVALIRELNKELLHSPMPRAALTAEFAGKHHRTAHIYASCASGGPFVCDEPGVLSESQIYGQCR
jgi:hypothetical protein